MIQRFLAVAFLCAVLGVLGGCSKRHHIEIQSDTCWTGSVDNTQSIYDCGNTSYKVVGPMRCVRVQKQSLDGYLRIRVDGGAWSETSAPYGITQACL